MNSTAFLGASPNTVKVSQINATLQREIIDDDEVSYWKVDYEFEYNRNSWNPTKILDAGLQVLDDNGKLTIATRKGKEVTEAILLDGNGQALAEGDDPIVNEHEGYESLSFSVFNFRL